MKQRMRDSMVMWSAAQKADLKFFSTKASDFAEHVYVGEVARSKLKRRNPSNDEYQKINKKQNNGTRSNGQPTKRLKPGSIKTVQGNE